VILAPLTQIDIRAAVQDGTQVAGASRLTTRPADAVGFLIHGEILLKAKGNCDTLDMSKLKW
jgi:hypothetical protein